MEKLIIASAVAAVAVLAAPCRAASAGEAISPWGICAHLNRADAEFNYKTGDQLRLMREAGIVSVRMDVGFSLVARRKGEYNFSHIDRVYEALAENGIDMLPILNGYAWEVQRVRPDAAPLHEHPEEWRGYVRAMAEHFKGRITVWSFWNEPDGGFWKPNPDPAQYVQLLKITHEELKKADPANRIMLGGIGRDFLKDVYRLDAKPYFDLISTHPYGWGGDREPRFDRNLDALRAVLAEHGDADKPVWFTECGASSGQNEFLVQQPEAMRRALALAGEKIGRPFDFDAGPAIGVPVLPDANPDDFKTARPWLPGVRFAPVSLEELADLDPEKTPVLLGAEHETIPVEFVDGLLAYVQRGGVLIANAQIPFYSESYINEHGSRALRAAAEKLHSLFRTNWHAHWTRPGTPQETLEVRPGPGMEELGFVASAGHVNRYLSGDGLPDEVVYTPILQAVHGDKTVGAGLALYTYKDWKGAVLASTLIKYSDAVSPQEQADLLQTFALHALSRGVPRFYFYVFRDTGIRKGEREDNFGLLRRDLRKKPSYHAYQAMTRALGATPEFVRRLPAPDGFFMSLFRRGEDGKEVVAFWSVDATRAYSVPGVGDFRDGAVHFIDKTGDLDSYRIVVDGK